MTGAQMTPGAVVPGLRRTITLPDMIAYAGATWDWHKLHYDPEFLAAAQLPAPVVDGQVFGALLAEQIQDWLGERAFITRLHFRFKNLVFAGETVQCTGTVTEVNRTDEEGILELVIESQVAVVGGDNPRIAAAPCGATVRWRA